MKYKFEIEGNKVTALCHYAGKLITASAKCNPEDEFDANVGMLYAAKRLDIKIQTKRYKRAIKRAEDAQIHAMIAASEVKDRLEYLELTKNKLEELLKDYDEFVAGEDS